MDWLTCRGVSERLTVTALTAAPLSSRNRITENLARLHAICRGVTPGLSLIPSHWHEPGLKHLPPQSFTWVTQLHLQELDNSDGTSHFALVVNDFSKNWQTEQSPETTNCQRIQVSISTHKSYLVNPANRNVRRQHGIRI